MVTIIICPIFCSFIFLVIFIFAKNKIGLTWITHISALSSRGFPRKSQWLFLVFSKFTLITWWTVAPVIPLSQHLFPFLGLSQHHYSTTDVHSTGLEDLSLPLPLCFSSPGLLHHHFLFSSYTEHSGWIVFGCTVFQLGSFLPRSLSFHEHAPFLFYLLHIMYSHIAQTFKRLN